MKKRLMTILAAAAVCICSTFFSAADEYASDTSVGGISSAIDISSTPGSAVSQSSSGSVSAVPGSAPAQSSASSGVPSASSSSSSSESYTVTGPGGSSAATASGTSYIYGPGVSSSSSLAAGSDHASDPVTYMELGFTVVSPATDYSGFKVAEASVQLYDGSWAEIGYDQFVRGGYYRLLREVTDTAGVDWYVVAAHATQIGEYFTSDGSMVTEIWLRKSDCTAASVFEINTSSTLRQNIVRTALSLLGNQYVYGEAGPDAYDCSGFVYYVMGANGISMPRSSGEICAYGTEAGITGLLPGDIVGREGHVGIYIGGDWFIHSSDTPTGVITESIELYNSTSNSFTSYRNVVGD